jgi:hypothetical protein
MASDGIDVSRPFPYPRSREEGLPRKRKIPARTAFCRKAAEHGLLGDHARVNSDASGRNWPAAIGFLLSTLGALGAVAFWVLVPAAIAAVGALLGLRGRRLAEQGVSGAGLATAAILVGSVGAALNVGLIAASAAGVLEF